MHGANGGRLRQLPPAALPPGSHGARVLLAASRYDSARQLQEGAMMALANKLRLPLPEQALPGRNLGMAVPDRHYVNGNPIRGPFAEGLRQALFGMGCFWGAERLFWRREGVFTTAVGYAGGFTPNPSYEEVCSGRTGHTEAVLVVYDPAAVSFDALLTIFWEGHDPTQGMRQGNDVGTQYRSAIYLHEGMETAQDSRGSTSKP